MRINKIASTCEKQKNVKEKGTIRAILGASAAKIMVKEIPASVFVSRFKKINQDLLPEQKQLMSQTADKILKQTGLADKGVNIVDFSKTYSPLIHTFKGKLIEEGSNAFYISKFPKFVDKLIKKYNVQGIVPNSINYNSEKFATSVFHEMGHAFNANKSKFWLTAQKLRAPFMALSAFMMLFSAATKQEKAEDGKELTKKQKVKNSLRKNSGIIAALATLPILAEETMASIRGCKWAKAELPKQLFNKVLKTNCFSFLSYMLLPVSAGLGAFCAAKLKDKYMQQQKEKAAMA